MPLRAGLADDAATGCALHAAGRHLVHGDAAAVAGDHLVKVKVRVNVAHAAALAAIPHIEGLVAACRGAAGSVARQVGKHTRARGKAAQGTRASS